MAAYVHLWMSHKANVITGEIELWKCSLCGLITSNKEKYDRWDEEIMQGGCTVDREALPEESGLRPFVRE